jgi:cell division protein FtsZ
MGYAMMGTATAAGDSAPVDAARKAINSPLMEEGGVLGARGVLINITASSHLSLHEVNEACNLIRAATQNDDVQINFGIVLSEAMGNEVKITVIATGFQRDTLPEIDRRNPNFPFTMSTVIPSFPPPAPVEPEPEPVVTVTPEPQPAPFQEDTSINDYDMPAILRKQRRMVQ